MKKICILILSMRSGTSVLTKCLEYCGLFLGKHVERNAIPGNSKGQFENEFIRKFNDEVLKDLNTDWNDLDLNNKLNKLDTSKYINILKKKLLLEFNNKSFILKDPRVSLLLPLYMEALKEYNIKLIYPIRNIKNIAKSLNKRDNMDMSKALELATIWRDIVYNYNYPLHEINFENIIHNPIDTLKNLFKELDLEVEINEKKILEFIDEKLVSF